MNQIRDHPSTGAALLRISVGARRVAVQTCQ